MPVIRRSSRPASHSGGTLTARSTVIKVDRGDDNTSRQVEYFDEFSSLPNGLGGAILPTPYNVERLFRLIDESNTLKQCIDAYVTNTVGTGWEIIPAQRDKEMDAGEVMELQSFLDNVNTEESLQAMERKVVTEVESAGFSFTEVIRDRSGRISLLRHAPALYTRLGAKVQQEVLVTREIMRGRRVSYIREFRKFRRFVQIRGGEQIWFKEFGDPRRMNRVTGVFEFQEGYQPGNDATELFHHRLHSNDPYGVPRWINQLPSILGSREAEEVNLRYFRDNTVPPMMLTVAGGRLTNGSYKDLTRMINEQAIGSARQNRMMIIEAVGEGDSMDKAGSPVTLKVEKLTDVRQSDGLFAEYDKANQDKVRSSWRLPAGALGLSQEQNFANAQVATFVSESQVYGPARDGWDEMLNKMFVNSPDGLGMKSVRLKGRVPSINSPETVVKSLTALNVIGAVTPRMAQQIANTIMQNELEEYPDRGHKDWKEWMDTPISITNGSVKTQAQQAVKSKETKEIEDDGDPGFKRPENGTEGEVLE